MKEIAKWLNITPPSASNIVDHLVKKKLVKRNVDKKDRRITIISLDERASKMFATFEQKRNLIFERMFNNLDKEDKNNLARILIKIITNQK
jgi:DNA-binding MarR family transcriptional regulator